MIAGLAAAAAVLSAAGPILSAAAPATSSWDTAFPAQRARGSLELVAVFTDRDANEHRVHLWREGDKRLRRDTSGSRIQIERATGSDDLYRIIRPDGVGYRVHQRNLFRISLAADWASLATLLARPREEVRVSALRHAAPPSARRFGSCRWSEVRARGLRICWSARLQLPLALEEKTGPGFRESLRIESLREGPIAAAIFDPPEGLREIDLDEQEGLEAD